jgi:UDP-glucose 4-epimerase
MKILVTGGAGFVGTHLIIRLLNDGYDVYSLDNYSTGFAGNEQPGCNYITGDIRDIHNIITQKITHIFHLAALARIQPSFIEPTEVFDVNVRGTQMVLEFARKCGAKVIFAGSSSRWHNPEKSPYAMSKYLGEQLCRMYRTSFGVPIQIARFYNVYGFYEITDGDYATVIGVWRRQMQNGEPLTIVGDGEQRRDMTHADDIADGLCLIMETEIYHDDAWELGTGVNYSINEIYAMCREPTVPLRPLPHENRGSCDTVAYGRGASMQGDGSPMLTRTGTLSCVYIPDTRHNYRETLRHNNDALDLLGWKPRDQLRDYVRNLQFTYDPP